MNCFLAWFLLENEVDDEDIPQLHAHRDAFTELLPLFFHF